MERRMSSKVSRTVWSRGKLGDYFKELPIAIKTAFALSIAENVAKSGKTVVFYSLEMQSSEIYERLLSKRAQIPMNTLIDRRYGNIR